MSDLLILTIIKGASRAPLYIKYYLLGEMRLCLYQPLVSDPKRSELLARFWFAETKRFVLTLKLPLYHIAGFDLRYFFLMRG